MLDMRRERHKARRAKSREEQREEKGKVIGRDKGKGRELGYELEGEGGEEVREARGERKHTLTAELYSEMSWPRGSWAATANITIATITNARPAYDKSMDGRVRETERRERGEGGEGVGSEGVEWKGVERGIVERFREAEETYQEQYRRGSTHRCTCPIPCLHSPCLCSKQVHNKPYYKSEEKVNHNNSKYKYYIVIIYLLIVW